MLILPSLALFALLICSTFGAEWRCIGIIGAALGAFPLFISCDMLGYRSRQNRSGAGLCFALFSVSNNLNGMTNISQHGMSSPSPLRKRHARKSSGVPLACVFYLLTSSTATATATVAPTMGLLPMPMRPIISTCAGTEEEPANWASLCIRPMVSVMP